MAAIAENPGSNLAASFAACRETTRRHAKSFYFSSLALPPEKRNAAYAIYAFCRYADDRIDRASGPEDAGLAAAELGGQLDRLLAGHDEGLAFAPAFRRTVERYRIEPSWFHDLVEGVCRDKGSVRMRDWTELRDYCYHVASVVGLMMASIFGLKDERGRAEAVDLGIAMQLTNILRDVREDLLADRIYLPAEELARFGLGEPDLVAGVVTPEFVACMQFQIARAREYYERAERGIPLLDDDGSQTAVWMMRHVYAGILNRIERSEYDVFSGRVSVSLAGKLALGVRAWRDQRRYARGA